MAVGVPCLHGLDDVDPATAKLILQLHNGDIEELLHASKGKSRDDHVSDADLAITTYQKELHERSRIIADQCMARSLTQAILNDAALLGESLVEENAATEDRALAHRLAGLDDPSAAAEQRTAGYNDGFLARLEVLYVSGRDDEGEISEDTTDANGPAEAESSAWAASRQKTPAEVYRHCIACDSKQPLFDVFQAPCGHHYCQECLRTLFELSTTDEALFPPRCCRQMIPLQFVKLYLSPTLLHNFASKSIEFKTSDRTYCCRSACSSFITSANITGERATCTACGTHVCTICKNNAHDGDCPEDTATQQVLETAQEQGWQRCYNCRRLIELDVGCNHMICPCGAQFCYICGGRWKTCRCDQWNEDRLMARANQVIARDRPQAGVARERQIDQAAANLRERHNCTHENWRYVPGSHQCEQCYYLLPQYVYECTQCRVLTCQRCRRNRL